MDFFYLYVHFIFITIVFFSLLYVCTSFVIFQIRIKELHHLFLLLLLLLLLFLLLLLLLLLLFRALAVSELDITRIVANEIKMQPYKNDAVNIYSYIPRVVLPVSFS